MNLVEARSTNGTVVFGGFRIPLRRPAAEARRAR